MFKTLRCLVVGVLAGALAPCALAGGPFGIDHPISPDESGIWARRYTLGLEYGVVAAGLGTALWLGGDTELGMTSWQVVDAEIFGQAAAQAGKYVFGRERPSQTSSPDEWFKGLHAQSFPSGEVTLQASFATPLIAKYAERDPWVWSLELLPAYDAVARVKQGGHWQSDVVAGWALGSAVGYAAARDDRPVFLNLLPHGLQLGVRMQF